MTRFKRYVLFHPGGAASPRDIEVLKANSAVRVLDNSDDRALLADIADEAVAEVRTALPAWLIEEERIHPHPTK